VVVDKNLQLEMFSSDMNLDTDCEYDGGNKDKLSTLFFSDEA
jgi:hypothetical protein